MSSNSARFNVVSQLSESLLARIIREQQYSGNFPSRLQNRQAMDATPLGIRFGFSYDIQVGTPTLSSESGNAAKLLLSFDVDGKLELDASIGPRPPISGSTHSVPVEFHGRCEAQVPLSLARNDSFGYLELATRELRAVGIDIEYDSDVGENGPFFDRMIERALLYHLYELASIPISHGFQIETTTGWAISNHAIRIINGPTPADHDNVTIAQNTWPNRYRGRRTQLRDWVNPNFDFAICYDERLLTQALELALSDDRFPREYDRCGCPRPGGRVWVEDITLNLEEGRISIFISARHRGLRFNARGRVTPHIDPGPILRLDVETQLGSARFLKGVTEVLARAIFSIADIETFANSFEAIREDDCRSQFASADLCDTELALELHAPVPETNVQLKFEVEQFDITSNEITTNGRILLSHG